MPKKGTIHLSLAHVKFFSFFVYIIITFFSIPSVENHLPKA